MRHPTEGVLRRLLDEPDGVAGSDRAHVDGCAHCRSELAAAGEDAARVETALSVGALDDVDLDDAWHRVSTGAGTVTPLPASRPRRRAMGLLRRPAAAALAVTVVLAGAGTAAANDWLQIFRTESVAPVSIRAQDLLALPDLAAYGELALTGEPDVHEVPDAAAAEAESGLDVPAVADLPRGVTGDPVLQVGGKVSATFTFSAERAARAAAAAGEPLPPPPAGLDGSAVRLTAGPGVAQVWSSSAGAPALLVARAVAPTAYSSGVPFDVVRDYLLSLPGLPDDVAAQLRTFTADGSTLPLPVPAGRFTTSSADVDGARATVLTTRDRTLAAVLWVDEGMLTVVAGSLDEDEVLSVARGLE